MSSFHHPYRMTSSGLQEMFSRILLAVDETSMYLEFLFVLDFEFWGGKQNSIPYMWLVILTSVPIVVRIVGYHVDGFFDVSSKVVSPAYYIQVFHICAVPCYELMVICGSR